MAIDNTSTLIQAVTVGSGGAANIEFASIPQTYTDLQIVLSGRDSGNGDWFSLNFNNSSSNFSGRQLFSNGSGAFSYTKTDANEQGVNNNNSTTSNTFGNTIIYIPNYTSSDNKSYNIDSVTENLSSTAYVVLFSGLWSNSTAISNIKIIPSGSGFAQYSTAYLYGVKSISTVAKAEGGLISQDEDYFYHTFTSSGTFTPKQSLTADMLLVAGGGGGAGQQAGGGGGAGGLLGLTSQSLSVQGYSVTVGGGGTGTFSSGNGGSGSSSIFGSLGTATGGGGGGNGQPGAPNNGLSGGSGGGGSGYGSSNTSGGTGVSGQGFAGGRGLVPNNGAGGGGGGAGEAGADSSGTNNRIAGRGGDGSTSYTSWGLATNTGHNINGQIYYAGGGGSKGGDGSGRGGYGGGAEGSEGIVPVPQAMANTGGGGGANQDAPSNGGSGIVIVRYAK